MPTESVEILISAKDTATGVIARTADEMKKADKAVKQMAGSWKNAGESVARTASVLGGGWMSKVGSDVAGLADSFTKAREAMGSTGASANVLKAGMVAMAGVAGFQLGKVLGDLAFRTEHWRKELEKAKGAMDALNNAAIASDSKRHKNRVEEIDGSFSESQRRRRQDEYKRQLEMQATDKNNQILRMEADLEKQKNSWGATLTGGNAGSAIREQLQQNIDGEKRRLEEIKRQRDEMRDAVLGRDREDQQKVFQLFRGMGDAGQKTADLLAKSFSGAGSKIKKSLGDSVTGFAESYSRETQELARRTKAFQQRDEADEWDRKVRRAERNREIIQSRWKPEQSTGPLAASESRLLSRNPGIDIARQQLDAAKRQEALLKTANATLKSAAESMAKVASQQPIVFNTF